MVMSFLPIESRYKSCATKRLLLSSSTAPPSLTIRCRYWSKLESVLVVDSGKASCVDEMYNNSKHLLQIIASACSTLGCSLLMKHKRMTLIRHGHEMLPTC